MNKFFLVWFRDMVWLVVNFTEENCVEVVLRKWFVNEKSECFWPRGVKRDKIWTMIKNDKNYPQEDWTIHKVEVLGHYGERKIFIVRNPN